MPNQTVFSATYLKQQLKTISEKKPEYNVGKFYISYNFTIEQLAFVELLIAECIKEIETNK